MSGRTGKKKEFSISIEFEQSLGDWTIGVDEAGRGPLAGGVFAAAVCVPLSRAPALLEGAWRGMDDSKKLSAKKREALAAAIRSEPDCVWAVASASPREIDSLNILRATHLAMARAVGSAMERLAGRGVPASACHALVDGLPAKGLPCDSTSLVKGDARSLFVAAASILAKTSRDADCERLEREYPGYGFAKHKGYPTKDHLAALAKSGPCPEHRLSFAPVAQREFAF